MKHIIHMKVMPINCAIWVEIIQQLLTLGLLFHIKFHCEQCHQLPPEINHVLKFDIIIDTTQQHKKHAKQSQI